MANNNNAQQKKLSDLLKNEGLYFETATDGAYKNMAHLSLQCAIKTYFKTADDLTEIVKDENAGRKQEKIDKDIIYSQYTTDVCDIVLHLQHFFELYTKDILLSVNPLLVYNAKNKYDIQLKMIQGTTIPDSQLETLYFIEGSEAFDKLEKLIDEPCFSAYSFIKRHFDLFKQVNNLRNRIAHRGAFVLKYHALDELFGKYVIPFLKDLQSYDSNYNNVLHWDFYLHQTDLNPFDELEKEYQKTTVNYNKVYVLKMMSHAAYNNKFPTYDEATSIGQFLKGFYSDDICKENEIARTIFDSKLNDGAAKIVKCPVCGCETLFVYEDCCDDEDDDGNVIGVYNWVYKISCNQCGFHLQEKDFLDANSNGINEIDYYKEW